MSKWHLSGMPFDIVRLAPQKANGFRSCFPVTKLLYAKERKGPAASGGLGVLEAGIIGVVHRNIQPQHR